MCLVRTLVLSDCSGRLSTICGAHHTFLHTNADSRSVTGAEVLSALRSIVVNDEICRDVSGDSLRGVQRLAAVLSPYVVSGCLRGRDVRDGESSAAAVAPSHSCEGGDREKEEEEEVEETDLEVEEADMAEELRDAVTSLPVFASSAGLRAAPNTLPAASVTGPHDGDGMQRKRVRLVRAGFALLRSLAGSDFVKERINTAVYRVTTTVLAPLPLLLTSLDTLRNEGAVVEQALGTLAALALRNDSNKEAIMASGGLALVAGAMRAQPTLPGVQRAACLLVRNVVARSPARIAAAFEEGFEPLLQAAYTVHPVCRYVARIAYSQSLLTSTTRSALPSRPDGPRSDVAYACLRDMGVAYAETATGRAQADRAARAIAAGDISVQ